MKYQPTLLGHDLTKNLSLYIEDQEIIQHDSKTLRLKVQRNRPLLVIMGFLHAKLKYLLRIADLYSTQGFDILLVQTFPWQVLWPLRGSHHVSADVLQFMHANEGYSQIVLHGFSVGGYMWGEVLTHMARDITKYQGVLDRIVAQVWDSMVDIYGLPNGVAIAWFRKQRVMQENLRRYLTYFLDNYDEVATKYYRASSDAFHRNLVKAPALMFASKIDEVGTESFNRGIRKTWEEKGISVTWKCWDDSGHVGHFKKYREEYVQLIYSHLQSVNLLPYPEKLQLRFKL